MDVADVFPPFGLRVEAGPLVLRPITDEVLPELVEVVLAGVHAPELMPFEQPWTDAPAAELPLDFARYHWGNRASWTPQAWTLELAVEFEGRIVGCQGFATSGFLVTRLGETGSWLGREFQGRGIGTAMRQAMCALAFDHLGAEQVSSAAFVDNPASNAVSRKVGYQPNGIVRKTRREGEWQDSQKWLLTPKTFVRGAPITVSGIEPFRRFIGVDAA